MTLCNLFNCKKIDFFFKGLFSEFLQPLSLCADEKNEFCDACKALGCSAHLPLFSLSDFFFSPAADFNLVMCVWMAGKIRYSLSSKPLFLL